MKIFMFIIYGISFLISAVMFYFTLKAIIVSFKEQEEFSVKTFALGVLLETYICLAMEIIGIFYSLGIIC